MLIFNFDDVKFVFSLLFHHPKFIKMEEYKIE